MPLSVSELYRFFRDWHINTTMADYDCLTKSFCCRETGAAEVQKFLDSVAERGGALDDVLSVLFAWELQASYWPEGLFDANLCLRFPPSQDFPVEFRTQINYSRRNYVAPTDKRAPKTANPVRFVMMGMSTRNTSHCCGRISLYWGMSVPCRISRKRRLFRWFAGTLLSFSKPMSQCM